LVLCKSKLYLKNLKQVQIKKQNARPELLGELSEAKPELLRTDREFCFLKKQNSGNQPEFQSSIKKRTVNQTVVYFKKFQVQFFKIT
jgi:hypothetical protein